MASLSGPVTGTGSNYLLVTAVRDEERFIERTVQSVLGQSVRPLRWIIVSDGSTDRTDEIVRSYAGQYPWIELLRMPERADRNFGGKALAVNAGYERIKDLPHDFVGCLDGDISFQPDFFGFLLDRLTADPELGVVGTSFLEGTEVFYDYRFVGTEHVSGPCQLFRRRCFEEIGGYVPRTGGGVDHIAVLTARMKGWKTRTFTEKTYQHHRRMGSAKHKLLASKFAIGRLDFALGSHPLWEMFRVVYQMSRRPILLGGMLILAGYLTSFLDGSDYSIPVALIEFRRREQMERIKNLFRGRKHVGHPAPPDAAPASARPRRRFAS